MVRAAEMRRASRHNVRWPARIRSVAEVNWHSGQVLNLSVTGVLLQSDQQYDIGERVEVEIEFQTQPGSRSIISGVGYVVRDNNGRTAAIHFDLGCTEKAVS